MPFTKLLLHITHHYLGLLFFYLYIWGYKSKHNDINLTFFQIEKPVISVLEFLFYKS